MVYKPTYNWGAPSCMTLLISRQIQPCILYFDWAMTTTSTNFSFSRDFPIWFPDIFSEVSFGVSGVFLG